MLWIYQSEGFPRTRYFIPVCVGLGVGSSQTVVPRSDLGHFCSFGCFGVENTDFEVLRTELAVEFRCGAHYIGPGGWKGRRKAALEKIIKYAGF